MKSIRVLSVASEIYPLIKTGGLADVVGAEQLGWLLLMPGMVELHTDHLEAHYAPRPNVHWHPVAAVVSFDGQLATCGITTVMDSLRVWRDEAEGDILLMANILAAPLVGLAPRFATLVRMGGQVLLAGLMEHEAAEVTAAYATCFDVTRFAERDGWVCLAGRRR